MPKKTTTVRRRKKPTVESEDQSILAIDKHQLDIEWCRQPELYQHYAEELATARYELDKAKAELDIVTAEIDLHIRTNPDEYEIEKVTEATVKSLTLQQPGYESARNAMLKEHHKVRLLESLVSGLDHRRTALKCLVDLQLASYYAQPNIDDAVQEQFKEAQSKRTRRRGINRKKN